MAKFRIIKNDETDYDVEERTLIFWNRLHSTPGFPSLEKAKAFLKRYRNPEIVHEED